VCAWDELDQRVIDTAVKQLRTRLHACVKSKRKLLEHSLLSVQCIHPEGMWELFPTLNVAA